VPQSYSSPPEMDLDTSKHYTAHLETSKGNLTIELLADKAPRTVNNFVFLAREGYFDGILFHRVVPGFVLQTGDPTGTGAGSPGYNFKDELPPALPYGPGVVAMANAGRNTNGSQFFICSGPHSEGLNQHPNYTVFGRVMDGMDTVEKIDRTPVGRSSSGEMSRPEEDVKLLTVTIDERA